MITEWKSLKYKKVRRCYRRIVHDLRQFPYRLLACRFCSHLLPLYLIILAADFTFARISSWSQTNLKTPGRVCTPDGTFDIATATYNPWNSGSVFAVDLPIRRLSFTFGIAKAIDISWDVVVGRGLQALCAYLAYEIFTRALMRIMERSTISQDTFKALALRDNTVHSVVGILRGLPTYKGVCSKLLMLWALLSTIFVLVMPTWLSAMTGYTADISAFISDDSDGNLVPHTEFLPVVYTIHDGDRIGKVKDYPVTVPWDEKFPLLTDFGLDMGVWDLHLMFEGKLYGCEAGTPYPSGNLTIYKGWNVTCSWMWSVSRYASQYGFFGHNSTDSTFIFPNGTQMSFTKDQGILNISAMFFADVFVLKGTNPPLFSSQYNHPAFHTFGNTSIQDLLPFGTAYRDPATSLLPFLTKNPKFYRNATGTLYDLQTLHGGKGSCQQIGLKYLWGFNFMLSLSFIGACLVWMILAWGVYLDAYFNSRLDANKRYMGLERAALDLSQALQKSIDVEHIFLDNNTVSKLARKGQITYQDLPSEYLKPCRRVQLRRWWVTFKFLSWLKAELWWLVAFVVFTSTFITSTACLKDFWSPLFSWMPAVGVIGVILVGRDTRGRWIIFALFIIIFVIVDMLWIYLYPHASIWLVGYVV